MMIVARDIIVKSDEDLLKANQDGTDEQRANTPNDK